MFEGWDIQSGPHGEKVQKVLHMPRGWRHRFTDAEKEIIARHRFHPGGLAYDPRRHESIIFKKTDGHCAYCWVTPAITVDHVVAKSKGGSNKHENLIGACLACNNEKANMSLEDFRKKRGVAAFPFETYEKRDTSPAVEATGGRGPGDQVG